MLGMILMISQQMIESYYKKGIDFAMNILIAVIIFFVGRYIIKAILKVTKRIFDKSRIDDAVGGFINSVIKYILYGVLIIIMCDKVGIQTTSFIAILTSASLAIGLALQGSLSNFAGGVLILIMKPFTIGDYICCDLGEGDVTKIDIFYTTLTTVENLKVVIPNGKLADVSITNMTANDKRMIRFYIGISYNSDIKHVKETIWKMLKEDEYVLEDMKNRVIVKDYADSQITFEIRAFVPTENYWDAYFDFCERIKEYLDDAKIEIPYPQMDVHMKYQYRI